MCGIVGYVGTRPAVDWLIQGLSRLEYRGYDSAGVAYWGASNRIAILKSEGKLENVVRMIRQSPDAERSASHCGIGHTRWATHGKPTTQNAHPHRTGHVILVHNGIIENYRELSAELIALGHRPESETDSELYGFLVLDAMNRGKSLREAVRETFPRLRGSCSVVVLSEREPDVVVGVRNGTPLVAARDPKGGAVLASDAQAILETTRDVIFLENGDLIELRPGGLEIFSLESGQVVSRTETRLDWSADRLDKQGYAHFMLKEIFEQPVAVVDTLNLLIDRKVGKIFELADPEVSRCLKGVTEILLVACGTSWHAALVAKYWIETLAGIPAHVELASELRYRDSVIRPGTVCVAVTQSGETADTLAVVRDLKARGVPTLGITNVRGSAISREADATLFTAAGPEIGVAATKTFIAQLTALFCLASAIACLREPTRAERLAPVFDSLLKLPHLLSDLLQPDGVLIREAQRLAREFSDSSGYFFVGRGLSFPIALEGALKLKEIAYVHAEGYAAGELKHGPIAMIDSSVAVISLLTQDRWLEKTLSNVEEVRARGARILAIVEEGTPESRQFKDCLVLPDLVRLGERRELFTPFFSAPILQCFAYELAVLKGTDVDQPRNLAKSVTVE